MVQLFSNIVLFNGIYDIICAISMLNIIPIPVFDKLHISMFKEHDQKLQRMFAYWILTYGIIRVILYNNWSNGLVSITYFLEALCIYNEYMCNELVYDKSMFVIIMSVFFGIMTIPKN
jgi:hypothetical protein